MMVILMYDLIVFVFGLHESSGFFWIYVVDLHDVLVFLMQGKVDPKEVTHKVYFDVEIAGNPAGTIR